MINATRKQSPARMATVDPQLAHTRFKLSRAVEYGESQGFCTPSTYSPPLPHIVRVDTIIEEVGTVSLFL